MAAHIVLDVFNSLRCFMGLFDLIRLLILPNFGLKLIVKFNSGRLGFSANKKATHGSFVLFCMGFTNDEINVFAYIKLTKL